MTKSKSTKTLFKNTKKNSKRRKSKLKKNLRQFLKKPKSLLKLPSCLKEYWYVLLALSIITLVSYFIVLKDLPSPTKLKQADSFASSSRIFDRNGQLLYEIYADRNRTPVPLNYLPDYVKKAHIAIEDKNFYQHHGFASEGLLRASYNTLFRKKLQGGSTITQQLVKTALLSPERTIRRKIREAVLSLLTELIYSKDQILEMYLNHVPYGGTAWGIESAAQNYFAKQAKDLTLAEASLLAGLPAAPTRYSPFGANPELAQQRQKLVLTRMQEDGYINQEEKDEALNQKLEFAPPLVDIKAPHFVIWIKELLVDKYGQQLVERGGLKITTTLDLELQEYTQASVSAEINDLEDMRVGNGAALITRPKTGEILAMIGSRDYFDREHDGNVNVTIRPRQPGSSIKPINYAAAFQLGKLNPASVLLDVPTCFFVPGQPSYCPRNYDNSFHGPVQARFALANSYNIPAVKVLALNSIETMIATASAMGISGWQDPSQYGLSLTLGGGEVKMVDMAVAFGVFANRGIRVPLQPILKVEDQQGNILEELNPSHLSSLVDQLNNEESDPIKDQQKTETEPTRVLSKETAYLISHILLDNNSRASAFGFNSQLVIPNQVVSVKTGTTNDLRDNWTIGFTPSYLVAAWVGNNDNSPMHPYLVSGITGAAPIWNALMTRTLAGQESQWPERPEGIIGLDICSLSGLRPNPENPCATRHEFFNKSFQPKDVDQSRRGIWIKKDTNLPPEEGDFENIELREHTVISDPFTENYCLDCPWPQDIGEDGQPTGKIHYPQITINTITLTSQSTIKKENEN